MADDRRRQDYLNTLGPAILALRVERGPTLDPPINKQAQLAKLVGTSAQTVGRWERGKGAPDAWQIRRLCEIFDVEPVELIRPKPLTPREREVLRWAGRQVGQTLDQEHGDAEGPA